jgi:hypothetical protein
MSKPEDDDDERLLDPAWSRSVSGYGTFKPDRQRAERGYVEDALSGDGFTFADLASTDADPPDCTAMVNGVSTGIEVTELVDEKALKRSIEALAVSPAGRQVYRNWSQEDLLRHLQALISKKEGGKWNSGTYQCRMLVIHTDEMTLSRDTATRFLNGHRFTAGFFNDVVLVLSYDPSTQDHPTFRLPLEPP